LVAPENEEGGETPLRFYSFNSCIHRERILHFSLDSGKLQITEVVLEGSLRYVSVATDLGRGTTDDWTIGCCSLGQYVLLMAGSQSDVFAALLDVDGGPVDETTIPITELPLEGNKE